MNPEGPKLLHETYKHLTTLSSAAILVISTFLAKGDMTGVRYAYFAIVSLLVCNACSIFLMFGIAKRVSGASEFSEELRMVGEMLTILSFLAGLALIALFGSANFSR